MHVERVESELRDVFGGRPWLVATDVLQGGAATQQRLRELGAEPGFIIAGRMGTGAVPDPENGPWRLLDLPPQPMMAAIHASEQALRDLPAAVQQAVDAFDPARRMRVIGAIFSDGRPVAGRAYFGSRPAAWQALEDKVTVDALWDEVGAARAPSQVVDVALEPLTRAAKRLDQGAGTVWSGDALRGFHGGATYTCWVQHERDAPNVVAHLAGRCARARVMPFLEGIPCSIHGIVFPDYVMALRPAEMLVLRRPGSLTGFLYTRAATFWDPPAADREAMRTLAKRVGTHLRESLGYRGAFTIDGVLTAAGFLPTELNPRVGVALGMMTPNFPFSLLHDTLVEGITADWDPEGLETEILTQADASRHGSVGFVTDVTFDTPVKMGLSYLAGRYQVTPPGEAPDATLSCGAGPAGGFVNLVLVPDRTPVGPSMAPRAAALIAFANSQFGVGLGMVKPASDVRKGA